MTSKDFSSSSEGSSAWRVPSVSWASWDQEHLQIETAQDISKPSKCDPQKFLHVSWWFHGKIRDPPQSRTRTLRPPPLPVLPRARRSSTGWCAPGTRRRTRHRKRTRRSSSEDRGFSFFPAESPEASGATDQELKKCKKGAQRVMCLAPSRKPPEGWKLRCETTCNLQICTQKIRC